RCDASRPDRARRRRRQDGRRCAVMTRRLRGIAAVVAGMILGGVLTVVGLAQAGRLAPQRPDALVSLGQLLEAEHRRVDLFMERGEVEEAIGALEGLRKGPW